MVTIKTYSIIFATLVVMTSTQAALEFIGIVDTVYWTAFGVILVISFVKSLFVAGYFQHLRFEPRSLSYLILTGLSAALALTLAAAYSIT